MSGNKIRAEIKHKIPNTNIPKGVKVTLSSGSRLAIEHQETKSHFYTYNYTPEKGIDPYLNDIREMLVSIKRRIARTPLNIEDKYPAWTYFLHPFSLWAALRKNPARENWQTKDLIIEPEVDTPVLEEIEISRELTLISKPGSVIINMKGRIPEAYHIKYTGKPISKILEMPSCGRDWVDKAAKSCIIDKIEFGPEALTSSRRMELATWLNARPREEVTLIHLCKTEALPCEEIPKDAPADWIAAGRPYL